MNELLLSFVFGLHLLAVDLAMAGPLLAVWLEWRAARNGEPATDSLARGLAGWSLAALAVGIGLGLLALALVPTGDTLPYRRAIGLLDARRWWFVGGELLFYFIAAGAYVGFWRQMKNWPNCHRALAVVAATDLIYHFPPLFAVVSTLSLRPQLWGGPLDHKLYWQLLLDGETISASRCIIGWRPRRWGRRRRCCWRRGAGIVGAEQRLQRLDRTPRQVPSGRRDLLKSLGGLR